jgi:hypothetical protein
VEKIKFGGIKNMTNFREFVEELKLSNPNFEIIANYEAESFVAMEFQLL